MAKATGQRVIVGPGRPGRPPYPKWPLDPDCLEPGEPRPDVVALVRLVVTDFDPETDPAGWDSVADLVHGDGRPPDEVRQMDYHALAAFFRNRRGRLTIQLGGTIETNTATIVSAKVAPSPEPPPQSVVLGRANLEKRLQDDWATSTGKRFLLGETIRTIADHYGVVHSSLYCTFWNTTIRPARKTTGLRAKAVEWVDSLSRDGR